ncbi:hypothetical protein FACS1894199_19140 [Bacteroidia bacterium]|nr:hypothetical protein FACS1894199_19140 [Bacteroidia bacterium]
MANTNLPNKKRKPRAWLYENGVRKPLVYKKTSDRISPTGMYMRTHPSIKLTEDEIRSVHFQG